MATKKSVTINEEEELFTESEVPPQPVDEAALERQRVLRNELARMKERDENAKAMKRHQRLQAVKEAKEKMYKEKVEKGVNILPEAADCPGFMKRVLDDEYRLSLKDKQVSLEAEQTRLQAAIDEKLGISAMPKGEQLLAMTANFYDNQNAPTQQLPEYITKTLTTQEINDLRVVFEMFDARNKGYITADDLRRASAMLGYKAKKRIFKEMIDGIAAKDKKGRVTFVSFLDLVIRLQADGPDPYEEMQRGFRLIDKGDKGFLTFADIRQAADTLSVPLSNGAIREMMEEADLTGDGKITTAEFVRIITQAETFTTPPS